MLDTGTKIWVKSVNRKLGVDHSSQDRQTTQTNNTNKQAKHKNQGKQDKLGTQDS